MVAIKVVIEQPLELAVLRPLPCDGEEGDVGLQDAVSEVPLAQIQPDELQALPVQGLADRLCRQRERSRSPDRPPVTKPMSSAAGRFIGVFSRASPAPGRTPFEGSTACVREATLRWLHSRFT